ncbi:MAG TPA: ABC transporter permease [Tissierellia bacterium]|jgi:peptide/nickel transport system permease protein|nr:ABC transporter permease [Tissierellia bacterium]
MVKTFLRRLLQIIPTLLVVVSITFVITRMIPGNPAVTLLGPQASVEDIAKLEEELGLNDSLWKQYTDYVGKLLKGDFGKSYSFNQPVAKLLMDRLPNTLLISLTSIVLAILIGIPIGIISAVKQYTPFDYISMVLALIGVSMPIFWLGLMLVLVFSVNLGWLPSLGMGSLENGLKDVILHMVLPVTCLTTIPTATFARITRSSMLEVINAEYIKSIRAGGLKEGVIIYKHALKNALPPIVTVLGIQLASSFTGAILTETIFSWPGMGTLIVGAIENRDYMLIQGAVVLTAAAFVFINLIVDIVYMIINPKVNLDNAKGGE